MAPNSLNDVIQSAAKGEITLIDVREGAELRAGGMARGAVHIPLATLALKAAPNSHDHDPRLSTARPVAVYCAAGARAGMAVQTLHSLGYQATNIGGFGDWAAAGGPVQAVKE
jgi:rhodanese-related sulfurtransferase